MDKKALSIISKLNSLWSNFIDNHCRHHSRPPRPTAKMHIRLLGPDIPKKPGLKYYSEKSKGLYRLPFINGYKEKLTLNPSLPPYLTQPPPPPEPPKFIKELSGGYVQDSKTDIIQEGWPAPYWFDKNKFLEKAESDKPSDFLFLSGKVTPIIDLSDKEEAITKAHLEAGPDAQFKEGFEAAIEYLLNKIKN